MVSTQLKNISQIGSFPQMGVKIKNIWNHHLVIHHSLHNSHSPKNTVLCHPQNIPRISRRSSWRPRGNRPWSPFRPVKMGPNPGSQSVNPSMRGSRGWSTYWNLTKLDPRCSMYVIFTYIWLFLMVNVGKYTPAPGSASGGKFCMF